MSQSWPYLGGLKTEIDRVSEPIYSDWLSGTWDHLLLTYKYGILLINRVRKLAPRLFAFGGPWWKCFWRVCLSLRQGPRVRERYVTPTEGTGLLPACQSDPSTPLGTFPLIMTVTDDYSCQAVACSSLCERERERERENAESVWWLWCTIALGLVFLSAKLHVLIPTRLCVGQVSLANKTEVEAPTEPPCGRNQLKQTYLYCNIPSFLPFFLPWFIHSFIRSFVLFFHPPSSLPVVRLPPSLYILLWFIHSFFRSLAFLPPFLPSFPDSFICSFGLSFSFFPSFLACFLSPSKYFPNTFTRSFGLSCSFFPSYLPDILPPSLHILPCFVQLVFWSFVLFPPFLPSSRSSSLPPLC